MKKNTERMLATIFAVLMIIGFANAAILVGVSTDKKEFYPNEVGAIKITIYNDSNIGLDRLVLRMEGGKAVKFVDGVEEQSAIAETIEQIGAGQTKEITSKIKIISAEEQQQSIFVYYGENEPLQNVSGTYVTAKENPTSIKTSISTKNTVEGKKITVDFRISAAPEIATRKIIAELLVPQEITVKTPPAYFEDLGQNGERDTNFEAIAAARISGEQTMFLAYGYIDNTGPHYFEKKITVMLEQDNSLLIAGIAIVIFIIAAVLYLKKGEKVKGTDKK
ncbi:MAG: hypothetical protein WC308_00960 [archaeon]|jgi:hypothetical protein